MRTIKDIANPIAWLTLGLAVAIGAASWGCRSPAGPPPTLDQVAEGYVRVALQLAQHDPDLVDDWRGPEEWKPGPRTPVAPILEQVRLLRRTLDSVSGTATGVDRYRAAYLDGQLAALASAAGRLLGETQAFDDEAREAVGVTTPFRTDPAAMASARDALAHLLPGDGLLDQRYAAYKARMAVSEARIDAVLREALAACREVTTAAMALSADEHVEVVLGGGSRWDGFARYLGGHRTRIEINRQSAFDVTRALRLACHEGYPGHHVQYLRIDDELVVGRGWREFGLSPGFGPHLVFAEGTAEAAADAAFPSMEREALYRERLLPAAGLPAGEAARLVQVEDLIAVLEPAIADISRAYLDNTITHAQATERLRSEALTQEPGALLAFAERRRARLLAYPEGRARARTSMGRDGLAAIARWYGSAPFRF